MKVMEWVKAGLEVVCIALLCVLLGILAWHLPGWCNTADDTLSELNMMARNANSLTAETRAAVRSLDVHSLNASLQNVQAATGNAAAVTSQVRASLPKIDKAAYLLWKHTDETLGHLAEATSQERGEQRDIAVQTLASLKSVNQILTDLDRVITDPNIPKTLADTEAGVKSLAAVAAYGEHTAQYIDHKITAPKRWFVKVGKYAGDAVDYALRHF